MASFGAFGVGNSNNAGDDGGCRPNMQHFFSFDSAQHLDKVPEASFPFTGTQSLTNCAHFPKDSTGNRRKKSFFWFFSQFGSMELEKKIWYLGSKRRTLGQLCNHEKWQTLGELCEMDLRTLWDMALTIKIFKKEKIDLTLTSKRTIIMMKKTRLLII